MSSDSLTAPLPEAATAAGVGLGYGIAIAVGILVLISTIMLASYLCVRAKGGPRTDSLPIHHPAGFVGGHDAAAAVGLDGPAIASFPKFLYGVGDGGGGRAGAPPRPVAGPCPICLSEYEAGEELRVVPECGHGFHAGCVDEWLRVSATCPLCRSSPVPSAAATPVATPLSELIPLAVHAR